MSTPALPPKPEAILQAERARTSSPALQSQPTRPAIVTSSVPKIGDKILNECSEEELQALLDNPEQLDAFFIAHHPPTSQYADALEQAERENAQIRARLETLRPELLEKKFEVENAIMQTKELEQQWEEVERQMYVSMQPMTSSAIRARLQAAVTEAQNTSESMLSSFLDFGPALEIEDLQDFVKEYRQVRKRFHLRSARLERMKEERVSGFR